MAVYFVGYIGIYTTRHTAGDSRLIRMEKELISRGHASAARGVLTGVVTAQLFLLLIAQAKPSLN
jgi:hypothetical protein